jgi:hypothetical protein
MLKWLLACFFVITALGCGGSSGATHEGEEYYVGMWMPFDTDEAQRAAAIAICEKFEVPLIRRSNYRFWTYLTPEKVVLMAQDERVAYVGEYFISISKPFRGNLAQTTTLVEQICTDHGIRLSDSVFSHFFSAQMTVKQAAVLKKDERIEFVSQISIGGGTGARQQP